MTKPMPPAIPILMYHKVGATVREKADTFLNVSARDFGRQMRMLWRMGCTGVTFAHAVEGLKGGPLPRRPACVTFDDGYTNVREHALPVLRELDWPGTVFVPTAYVGGENRWDRETGKPLLPIMGWDEIRSLQSAGWEIAGHTRSHPNLQKLDRETAMREIEQGRADIADRVGEAPRTFCYPFGGLNETTPGLVREAGFVGACTTKSGLATARLDPYLLPRVKVAYRDGLPGLFYRLKIRPLIP